MRIGINCRSFLRKQYAGIGRYAYNLVDSLAKIDKENEYYLYARKGFFDFKKKLRCPSGKNFHKKVDVFNRGAGKSLRDVDIYHSPSPDYLPDLNGKIIATVHDLIYKSYPEGHIQETIDITEAQLNKIVKKADKIICCSKSTLSDLHKYFTVDPSRTHVIYQGVDKEKFYPFNEYDKELAKSILREKGVSDSFILFVGTIEPRKNLKNLIEAVAILKEKRRFSGKLVVAGMKGWMSEDLAGFIEEKNLKGDVQFLGYVTDFELCALYNIAEVFVFPSFYEGFGFPIVEAFSCGAAVVTSDVSSCSEVALDAAVKCSPYEPEFMSACIGKLLEDKDFADDLKKKALKRAQDFSFEKTAEKTLEIYKEVYSF